jgi:hypothetical protein
MLPVLPVLPMPIRGTREQHCPVRRFHFSGPHTLKVVAPAAPVLLRLLLRQEGLGLCRR